MFNEKRIVVWPVGTGDSTSVVVDKDVVLQVDLRDMHTNGNGTDEHVALVDTLVANLPSINGRPYLAGFALTHPDQDHILGFEDLLKRVDIGEIWFTPRVFVENDSDLCNDAIVFKEEAERRVKLTIKSSEDVGSGNRVRLIGYDSILDDDEYKGFPADRLTVPGNSIAELDGINYSSEFNTFIHAPFLEENEGDRNNTSLCMQVTYGDDPAKGGALLFGDIAYPRIRRIFDTTAAAGNDRYLAWKFFLAPHHCSKSAMYQKEDDNEALKQDMLDDLAIHQVGNGIIVASCEKIPSRNKTGDNPPHAKAKKRYEEVAEGGFMCTHENGGKGEPLVFDVIDDELYLAEASATAAIGGTDKIANAVEEARGTDSPPTEKIGYGF